MRDLFNARLSVLLCGAVAGVAMAGAPALAQTVDEVTVTGRLDDARSLSQVVSYRDLDLRFPEGRAELTRRVSDTARSLCDTLGESASPSGPVPSCRQAAVRDAMKQVRTAYAAADRGETDMAWAADEAAMPASDTVADTPAETAAVAAPAATDYAPPASYTTSTVTNGPVADTAANRSAYGGPLSNAGQRTAPAGN